MFSAVARRIAGITAVAVGIGVVTYRAVRATV